MKPYLLASVAMVLLPSAIGAEEIRLGDGTLFRFADVDTGRKIITTEDDFLKRLSPFDLAVRLETDKPVTLEQLKERLAAQVLPWREEQQARLRPILTSVADKLAPWKLNFPETVLWVRTTGIGEGPAAYTRGNAVVLPDEVLAFPEERLTDLLLHELFHILSRYNPELRDRLYRIVSFERSGEIALPPELARRKITNPDAPVIEHIIHLTIDGRRVPVAPLLLSRSETYDVDRGGTLFDYLQFRLLEVEQADGDWQVAKPGGQPRLYVPEAIPNYLETIGRNTRYIIHPEEILADNFVLLVQGRKDVASPHILRELDRQLRLAAETTG